MKKNIIAVPVVTALLLVAAAVTASAQGDTSRGYLQGQQQNTERCAKFEQLAELSTDVEREDFFRAAGIGGAYSAELHLDAEELVDAFRGIGHNPFVITETQADAIQAYLEQ